MSCALVEQSSRGAALRDQQIAPRNPEIYHDRARQLPKSDLRQAVRIGTAASTTGATTSGSEQGYYALFRNRVSLPERGGAVTARFRRRAWFTRFWGRLGRRRAGAIFPYGRRRRRGVPIASDSLRRSAPAGASARLARIRGHGRLQHQATAPPANGPARDRAPTYTFPERRGTTATRPSKHRRTGSWRDPGVSRSDPRKPRHVGLLRSRAGLGTPGRHQLASGNHGLPAGHRSGAPHMARSGAGWNTDDPAARTSPSKSRRPTRTGTSSSSRRASRRRKRGGCSCRSGIRSRGVDSRLGVGGGLFQCGQSGGLRRELPLLRGERLAQPLGVVLG